ncbi:putative Bro-N domain-containing protein [Yalta virus]|nr:putative Bro-N domain-containing protein [Yalta virus]
MTSFNELAITFKNIIDDLFNSNNFECRKLVYGKDIYYCGRDILKCLNYNEDKNAIKEVLLKLDKSDKFTIKELEEKYSSGILKLPHDNFKEINKEILNSLNQYEMKYIYINKIGLYELIGSSKKPEAKPFKNFIYRILLPALDNKYEELLNQKDDKINQLQTKIDQLLKNTEQILDNTEILKQNNEILKEDNNIINEELNTIKEELTDVNEKQDNLINTVESVLIPNRNLPPNDFKLNHSFVMYKINDQTFYCLRGQNRYVQKKLKEVDPRTIIINNLNNPNPIDFYQKFKEESKLRLNSLREKIIRSLMRRVENFNSNSLKGKQLIDRNIEKLKEFTINSNILYLNKSSEDDILKFYNSLLEEKVEY